MIAKPPHNRKLGILSADLVKAPKIRNDMEALTATRDELEQHIISSGYLDGAPFSWVTISIRFGLKNDEKPYYETVSKKYGDLPLSIEVDTHELIGLSLIELTCIFKRAALRALIHAGQKYKLSIGSLEELLDELSDSG